MYRNPTWFETIVLAATGFSITPSFVFEASELLGFVTSVFVAMTLWVICQWIENNDRWYL